MVILRPSEGAGNARDAPADSPSQPIYSLRAVPQQEPHGGLGSPDHRGRGLVVEQPWGCALKSTCTQLKSSCRSLIARRIAGPLASPVQHRISRCQGTEGAGISPSAHRGSGELCAEPALESATQQPASCDGWQQRITQQGLAQQLGAAVLGLWRVTEQPVLARSSLSTRLMEGSSHRAVATE